MEIKRRINLTNLEKRIDSQVMKKLKMIIGKIMNIKKN